MIIALYHRAKIPIHIWCRWDLNLISLIQQQDTNSQFKRTKIQREYQLLSNERMSNYKLYICYIHGNQRPQYK